MILVNKQQITDLPDKQKELEEGVKYLIKQFGESIKFVRSGYPRKIKGYDGRGRESGNLTEPTQPLIIPLKANIKSPRGSEVWEYTSGIPKLQDNRLWEAVGKRSIFVTDSISVSTKDDPELAFFLFYKSAIVKGGQLSVYDPDAEARAEGDKVRANMEIDIAIYGTLDDEEQLRTVASAWGVAKVNDKHPDTIRKELKDSVFKGETRKRVDPLSRGVAEFKDDMKVTDATRLRIVINKAKELGILQYTLGKFKVGDRIIMQVPTQDDYHSLEYFCNWIGRAENKTKLQDLLQDLISKEFLDSLKDPKNFAWIGRVMELKIAFKKPDEIRDIVYTHFVGATVDETPKE
jgi:hypothetical protein